ncbi:hypothetical protein Aduo_001806 [Ancylostoma duodenale]
MELTEQEKDDFVMAERDVCETPEEMIELMFRLVAPRIICITTSPLLNTTDKGGIFKDTLANPARFGARSIIDTLLTAKALPIAPLVTTFRAHPALKSLPNTFAYDGT